MVMNIEKGGHLEIEAVVPGGVWAELAQPRGAQGITLGAVVDRTGDEQKAVDLAGRVSYCRVIGVSALLEWR